jgi:hypothetical protein
MRYFEKGWPYSGDDDALFAPEAGSQVGQVALALVK